MKMLKEEDLDKEDEVLNLDRKDKYLKLPPKEEIKLIACDLDGTLLNEHFEIHPKNKSVIKRFRKDYPDIPIVLATGRDYDSSLFVKEELDLKDFPTVNLQGMQITMGGEEESVLIDGSFAGSDAVKIFNLILEKGLCPVLEVENSKLLIGPNADPDLLFEKTGIYKCAAFSRDSIVPYHKNEVLQGKHKVKRILVGFNTPTEAISLIDFLNPVMNKYNFSTVRTIPYIVEIIPVGFNKGTAIRILCNKYGITMDNVLAFGDAPNDIEMLMEAKYSYAMGNAFTSVKNVAKYVAPNNEQGGVGCIIEEIYYGKQKKV